MGAAGNTGYAYTTEFSGKWWVGTVTAVSPLTVTVVKLRLGGPGIGARVVSRFRVILRGRLGMTVSDKACIAVREVVGASPSTVWAAPPSCGGLVRFLFVPCFGQGQL